MGSFMDDMDVLLEETSTLPPKKARKVIEIADVKPEASESKEVSVKRGRKANKEKSMIRKIAVKPLNDQEAFVQGLLKRSGMEKLPEFSTMFDEGIGNAKMKVRDIAIFIGNPSDNLLVELSNSVTGKNIINMSSEVTMRQVKTVGEDVLRSKKFYHTIEVATISDVPEGVVQYQAESGRHRLALIGLLWGTDVEVPIRLTKRTLSEARDSVVYANKTRATTAIEKADLIVTQAVNGDVDAKPDDAYAKVATSKARAVDFAFHRAMHNSIYGFNFDFEVSMSQSLDNCVTTATAIKGYLTLALDWDSSMNRSQFDNQTKESLKWLNGLVKALFQIPEFGKRQHMASQPLRAYGEIYKGLSIAAGQTGKSPNDYIDGLATKIVALGDIARDKKTQLVKKLST